MAKGTSSAGRHGKGGRTVLLEFRFLCNRSIQTGGIIPAVVKIGDPVEGDGNGDIINPKVPTGAKEIQPSIVTMGRVASARSPKSYRAYHQPQSCEGRAPAASAASHTRRTA